MADADLEEIRRARLQQLRQQGGSGSGNAASGPGASESSDQDAQRQREASQRASLLSQILLPEAADRLNRIRLVKESRAASVEDRLIMLARTGQLRAKVTEDQLKELLGAVAEQQDRDEPRIVVSRRGGGDEDEELEELMREV